MLAYDVFLSYSVQDKPVADATCATLEAQGLRCWIAPRDIVPGQEWSTAIIEGIEQSRTLVLLFSGHSNSSPQVLREVERAVAKRIPIVPFRLVDVPLSKALEYFISSHHWLDAFTSPLEPHLDQLAQTIKRLKAAAVPTDSPAVKNAARQSLQQCQRCAHPLQPGDKFCNECGQPVAVQSQVVPPQKAGPDKTHPVAPPASTIREPKPDATVTVDFPLAMRGGATTAVVKLADHQGHAIEHRIEFRIPPGAHDGTRLHLNNLGPGGSDLKIALKVLATKAPGAVVPWLETLQPWQRNAIETFLEQGWEAAKQLCSAQQRHAPAATQMLARLLASYNAEAELYLLWGTRGVEASRREGIDAETAIRTWLAVQGGDRPSWLLRPGRFRNHLGMEFVAVPGTAILMSIYETRVKDYAAYAAEISGVNPQWKDISKREEFAQSEPKIAEWHRKKFAGHKQDENHPVVNVNWEDATAFCQWLTRKAGRTVRLPTDHEWSCAVGIGFLEDSQVSPHQQQDIPGIYPWGTDYPPQRISGNYSIGGSSMPDAERPPPGPTSGITVPVGCYGANRLGIFDLSGNVNEWCLDHFWQGGDYAWRRANVPRDWLTSGQGMPLRGGSWEFINERHLQSSCRYPTMPENRSWVTGFRCVVEI